MRHPRPCSLTLTTLLAIVALVLTGLTGASAAATSGTPQYRPLYHFTPQQNWMNDPNGLIYHDGVYNLFFQYNPDGDEWGNISWGHATSTDLVHWTQQPLAIPFDSNETVFSGSMVYDKNNSSGLGTSQNPPLVAIYTSALSTGIQAQSLAYSTDGGTTWTKYSGNPVLNLNSTAFRDPKVFWYAPGHEWVMVVAQSNQQQVSFYRSSDLKAWTHLSDFGPAGVLSGSTSGVWECPDLFPLALDGKPSNTKWVLVVNVGGGAAQYFVGNFDGTTFTPDPTTVQPPAGTTLQNFDGSDYGQWTTTGTAFGAGPAAGGVDGQQPVTGGEGTGIANSFHRGDGTVGTLTSTPFTVTSNYLDFLVAGGNHPYVPGTSPDGTGTPVGQVISDFEGTTWDPGWTATGDFVGQGPAAGGIGGQNPVSGYHGQRLLNSFFAGDTSTGTLTSPTFTIDKKYIDLLVGGGDHPMSDPGPTAVNLLVGGQVVASATGQNSEALTWTHWDVSSYAGDQAQIQVADENNGNGAGVWGHILVDDIMQSDQAAQPTSGETGVNLVVDGQVVRTTTGNNSEALDWTSWNVADLKGKQAQIELADANSGSWGHIEADDFVATNHAAAPQVRWVDYGADFYATNTFNDAPGGQRIMMGWMSNGLYGPAVPTSPWRGEDSFPRTVELRTIDGVPRLVAQPVSSIATLHSNPVVATQIPVRDGARSLPISGDQLDLNLTLRAGSATRFGVNVRTGGGQYTQIGYDTNNNQLYIDRTHSGDVSFSQAFAETQTAPLTLQDGTLRLRILIDSSSVEVYGDQGEVALTDLVFPDASSSGVSLFADGGTATLQHMVGYRLNGR